MLAQIETIQNLEAIEFDGNEYKLHFRKSEKVATQYHTWVGTGNLKASGTIAKSKTLRHLINGTRTVEETAVQVVSKEEAKEHKELLDQYGFEYQLNDLSANCDFSKWSLNLVGGC